MKRFVTILAIALFALIAGNSPTPAYADGPITGQWVLGHWCNDAVDVSPVLYSPQQSYWWVPDPDQDHYDPMKAIGDWVTINNFGVMKGPDELQCIDGYGNLPAIVFGAFTVVQTLPAPATPTPATAPPRQSPRPWARCLRVYLWTWTGAACNSGGISATRRRISRVSMSTTQRRSVGRRGRLGSASPRTLLHSLAPLPRSGTSAMEFSFRLRRVAQRVSRWTRT